MLIRPNPVDSLISHLNEPGFPVGRKTCAHEKHPCNFFTLTGKLYDDRTRIKVRVDMDWTDLSLFGYHATIPSRIQWILRKGQSRTTNSLCTISIGTNLADFRAHRKRGSFAFLTELYLFFPDKLVSKEGWQSFFCWEKLVKLGALEVQFYINAYFLFCFWMCFFICKFLFNTFNNSCQFVLKILSSSEVLYRKYILCRFLHIIFMPVSRNYTSLLIAVKCCAILNAGKN